MSQLTRYGFSREAGRQHMPMPLVRRPVAYRGPWPILTHRTMAEIMAEEEREARQTVWPDVDWPDAPLAMEPSSAAPAAPQPQDEIEMPAGGNPAADDASGREGSAPEGTSGALAGAMEQMTPANADQSRTGSRAKAGDEAAGTEHASPCPAVEPVSRPAAGRSAAATSEPMDVTAGETATDPDPAPQPVDPLPAPAAAPAPAVVSGGTTAGNPLARVHRPAVSEEDAAEEFTEALGRVQARRSAEAREIRKAAPAIDFARVAAAARSRPLPAKPAPKVPTRHALSADPCDKCGVPGFRGCEHQLPYEDYTPAAAREDHDPRSGLRGPKSIRTGGRTWRL